MTCCGQGRLQLIAGCMFSGKTERLLEIVHDAVVAGRRVAVLKHASDDRYDTCRLVTHDGRQVAAMPVTTAQAALSHADQAEIIVIDEGQFFDDDIVGVCGSLRDRGCQVIVAGLDRDSWGLPFEPMPKLEAIADEVTRTQSTCSRCGAVATFTQRLTPPHGQMMVGGSESYEPRCETCFEAPPAYLRC